MCDVVLANFQSSVHQKGVIYPIVHILSAHNRNQSQFTGTETEKKYVLDKLSKGFFLSQNLIFDVMLMIELKYLNYHLR